MTETGVILLGLAVWMAFYDKQWENWLPAWCLLWTLVLSGSTCIIIGFFNFLKGLLS